MRARRSMSSRRAATPVRTSRPTWVIDVPHVTDVSAPAEGNAARWTLPGPGIQDRSAIAVAGLAPAFTTQWSANHALFPRGVDVFLAAPQRIVGLPRTTRIEQEA